MDTACSDSDEIKGARNGVTSWPCILKPGFAQFVIMMVTAVNHRDSQQGGAIARLGKRDEPHHANHPLPASRRPKVLVTKRVERRYAPLLRAVHGQA